MWDTLESDTESLVQEKDFHRQIQMHNIQSSALPGSEGPGHLDVYDSLDLKPAFLKEHLEPLSCKPTPHSQDHVDGIITEPFLALVPSLAEVPCIQAASYLASWDVKCILYYSEADNKEALF
ncbi:hypothetical protein DNTS_018362 [Danionella cerebrum]|uniref:Uncharacterized protein n=1 Tax=Danionella cerebrum TaxID=2873325 RepID=A0A553QKT5_9TELE|nr:hypothetical protein DNTS_018362 [Danionella translucida]